MFKQNFKTKLSHGECKALAVVLMNFDLQLMADVRMRAMVVMIMERVMRKVMAMSMRHVGDVAVQRLYKLSLKPGEAAALYYVLSLYENAGYEGLVHERMSWELNQYFA